MYEARNGSSGFYKAEEDISAAKTLAADSPPLKNTACFHCQQAAEKYLKALLQELGMAVPKTHVLEDLLNLLLPHEATLVQLKRGLKTLSRYAVEYIVTPGVSATTRNMHARSPKRLLLGADESEIRTRLGLDQCMPERAGRPNGRTVCRVRHPLAK